MAVHSHYCIWQTVYMNWYLSELDLDSHLPPVCSVVFISVAARAVIHPPAVYFAQGPEAAEPSDQ